jgi:hypothetical protein
MVFYWKGLPSVSSTVDYVPLSLWCLRRGIFNTSRIKWLGKFHFEMQRYYNSGVRLSCQFHPCVSQSIYHLTTLVVPPDTTHAMKKIERAFLWEATDKASRGQCMVNWDTVCRPENLGGLGIRNNDYFAWALQLRWPLVRVEGSENIWVGL